MRNTIDRVAIGGALQDAGRDLRRGLKGFSNGDAARPTNEVAALRDRGMTGEGARSDERRARVLLLTVDPEWGHRTAAAWLSQSLQSVVVDARESHWGDIGPLPPAADWTDLVLIEAGSAWPCFSAGRGVEKRTVLYGDWDTASAAALRAIGFENMVPGATARGWVEKAVIPLLQLWDARQVVAGPDISVSWCAPTRDEACTTVAVESPLPLAETRFREAYLSALLATSGSRAELAKRAGVPYRTMCKMLQKLDIKFDVASTESRQHSRR